MSDSDGSDYVPTEDEADAGDDGSNEEIRDEDYFDDAAAASRHEEGHWFTLFNVEHCRVLAEPASGEEGSDTADSDSGAAHDDDGASLSTVHDADRKSCILACRRPRMEATAGYYGDSVHLNSSGQIAAPNVSAPIYTAGKYHIDAWVAYTFKLPNVLGNKVSCKVQFNVEDLTSNGYLLPVSYNMDGSPAAIRIIPPRQYSLSAKFIVLIESAMAIVAMADLWKRGRHCAAPFRFQLTPASPGADLVGREHGRRCSSAPWQGCVPGWARGSSSRRPPEPTPPAFSERSNSTTSRRSWKTPLCGICGRWGSRCARRPGR